MTRVQVSLKDFPERIRKLEKKCPRAVERGMRDASLMLRGALVQNAIKQAEPQPVDQGQYKSAWGGRDVPGGAQVFNLTKQAFFIERGRKKGKMPPHAPIREWVRRKGIYKDRLDELKAEAAETVRRDRRDARLNRDRRRASARFARSVVGRAGRVSERNRATGRGGKSRRRAALPSFAEMRGQASFHKRKGAQRNLKDQAINEVAMLIRRKIGARGTPEKRVLRNAVERLKPKMPGILRRALREIQP